jgi:hypothetical protein
MKPAKVSHNRLSIPPCLFKAYLHTQNPNFVSSDQIRVVRQKLKPFNACRTYVTKFGFCVNKLLSILCRTDFFSSTEHGFDYVLHIVFDHNALHTYLHEVPFHG